MVAEKYASRLVVASGEQAPATRWFSHGDRAEKALAKLAGPHLPASLRALEQAVKRANRDYENAVTRATKAHRSKRAAAVEVDRQTEPETLDDADDELGEPDHAVDADIDGDVTDPGDTVGPDGNVYSDADPGR